MKATNTIFVRSARTLLLAGAAALAFPAAAYAQDAGEALPAADAPDEAVEEGNEIIVTATKREQTLQDVPVAVSVTTAETIERAQIRDLKDLSSVVPSLRVAERQASAQTNFLIRGFGNGANNAGIEPSVGVFVDGVYRSRSAAQIADLPDVQRIEVLRGPQSTLFGKNASVGVISISTEKPKFSFGGNVEASYGNYNAMLIKGVVTGPLSETIAASFAAGYNKRDGYNQDLATGNRTNERDRWFVRGQLLYKGDSGFSARLIGDYGKIDENCCGVVSMFAGPATAVLTGALGGRVNAANERFSNIVYNNSDSTNKISNYGISGQLDYETGPLNFTSITAYRKVKAITNQDSDFTSADLIGRNFQDVRIGTFTQEFRVNANFVDRVNALLGVFYFSEKIDQQNDVRWGTLARPYADLLVQSQSNCALSIFSTSCVVPLPAYFSTLPNSPPVPTPLETVFGAPGQLFGAGQGLAEAYRLKNDAFSVFAQVDFKVTDRLTLTGGINWTHDKKNFSTNVVSNDVFASIDFNSAALAGFRNTLLRGGAIAQQVGAALNLGRSATQQEIGQFAAGTSAAGAAGATAFPNIVTGATNFANLNQNVPAANPLNAFGAFQFFPPFLNVPNAIETGKIKDSNVSYTARLAYDISEDINAYISVASGYKGASINLSRDSRPTPADAATLGFARTGTRFAEPETTTVYELGLKAKWNTGSINLAVFKQNIKGFQSNLFIGTGFVLGNAEKESVFGVEVEGTFRPAKGWTFGASATFLDPKYDLYTKSVFGDASGTRPADIPSFSGTVSGQYDHEFGNADHLIFRADFHHESKVRVLEGLPDYITRNSAGVVTSYQTGIAAADPYTRTVNELNASLTYAMQNGIEVTAWGRNITNNRYINTIFPAPAQTFSISGYTNQPRTFGGSVRYRF